MGRRPRKATATAAPQDLLAKSRVHYVGGPVALIAAETKHQAQDAADRLVIEYGVLPAVTQPHAALQSGAAHLHEGGNQCFHYGLGDAAASQAAFARAHCVARLEAVNQRLAASPIETRGYAGVWNTATQSWTLQALQVIPTPSNLVGAKAVGEAGPTAAPPAVINAITDALGGDHIDMPATPERVWRALRV